MALKLILLGKPQIVFVGGVVDGRLPAKVRLLLCYLASTPRTHSRDQLAEWFWEGAANPRSSLRVALTVLRGHFGEDIVIGGRDTVAVNPDYDYTLDVEEFDNLIKLAEKVGGATQRSHLRDAVALYGGEFLQDIVLADDSYLYDEWLIPERERLRQKALAAYDHLVEICREQGDYKAGIQYAQTLLRLEPWRESAHRQLMRFYDLTGKRSQAIKQFDICADTLEKEFGLSPTDETFALYWQIVDPAAAGSTRPLTAVSPAEEKHPVPFLAPKLVPHFSGRDAELADLQEKLGPQEGLRLYGLAGQPGVGKTALAIELAHRLRDAFPDGILWMNADLDDPMSVAERWANAYGYDFSRISDVEERTAVLRDLLAEKQALIVCDDVINAARTRPFLPEKGRSTILLTSRSENLIRRLGAELVDVKVLTEENGRVLLASIVTEERVAAEEAAAVEIVTLLEGLPLAIAIAGQRLALRSRRKLASFVDQLRDESARIDLADQDRAVRTSFTVSWNGLDQVQQHVFTLAAVFAGRSFAVAAAAAITQIDYYDVLERLDELTSLSLLNDVGDERYRQHTLLADFAREKLGQDDNPYRRMIAYYQVFASGYNEDYAALELEWENLSASIEQAQKMALWPAVLELTDTLQPAWFRRGRYQEARRAFPLAVSAAEALDDQQALARCLYHWGHVCWEQGDWDEAQEKLTTGLNLFQEMGDLAGLATVQIKLACVLNYRIDYSEADRMLAASRSLREQLGDEAGVAETIYEQGQILYSRGDYSKAKTYALHALKLQESLPDPLDTIRTLRLLTVVVGKLDGETDLSKQYALRANQIADELQDQVEKPAILMNLSSVYQSEGDYQKAKKVAIESLEMRRKLGDRRGQAMVYYVLSEISERQLAYQEALQYGEQGLAISRALNDQTGIAFSLRRLGEVWECQNQFQKACEMWREALEIARQIQHRTLVIDLEKRIEKYVERG